MAANLMTCSGFDASFLGGCGLAWICLALLFFIVAFTRKWLGEDMGFEYSFILGLTGAFVPYLILVSIFASYKIALVAGIVGSFLLGYGGGAIFGGGGDSE